MPQQVGVAVENKFTKGLITDSTGLNFPEDAATDTDNCVYTLTGDVTRRLGIDKEVNGLFETRSVAGKAISSFLWKNVAGDGETQLFVLQIGSTLYFYDSSASTVASPLSNHRLATTVVLSTFTASGGSFDQTLECDYASGNGYLFVFHPNCEPIYCSYASSAVTAKSITVQIRDFSGISEPGTTPTQRPTTLTQEHLYNLQNQGWTQGAQ